MADCKSQSTRTAITAPHSVAGPWSAGPLIIAMDSEMLRSKIKTISEVEAARRRAITGLRNLGLEEQAAHVEGLSERDYAEERDLRLSAATQ